MRPHLFSFELAWTHAAFDALYPAPRALRHDTKRSRLPHGLGCMYPARFFDALLMEVPLDKSLGLRATIWMIALAPLFTIRRFSTISSLAAQDRMRVFEVLLASPNYFVRQLAAAFKAVGTLLYARSATVRSAMTAMAVPRATMTTLAIVKPAPVKAHGRAA